MRLFVFAKYSTDGCFDIFALFLISFECVLIQGNGQHDVDL